MWLCIMIVGTVLLILSIEQLRLLNNTPYFKKIQNIHLIFEILLVYFYTISGVLTKYTIPDTETRLLNLIYGLDVLFILSSIMLISIYHDERNINPNNKKTVMDMINDKSLYFQLTIPMLLFVKIFVTVLYILKIC